MTEDLPEVVYQIDRDDLLVSFNEQWDVFAEDNDSLFLASQKIHKAPIWQFIRDAETRHLHELLLRKVRTRDVMLDLAFRCDSPVLRRFMRMRVCMKDDGRVEYRSRIVRTEPREAVLLASPCRSEAGPFLRMCSWCKKMEVAKDSWMEIEDAVNFLGLFSCAEIQQISHTMCDACLRGLEEG
ncbi:hypothetical protein GCM10027046_09990 [Uliginosibacterium flavum]|uniref:Uncharacterized protein n=1 Tax=Uliginosibacterium flavum TaxID=1396831 RepID=A0ABV2TIG6_9RHOO